MRTKASNIVKPGGTFSEVSFLLTPFTADGALSTSVVPPVPVMATIFKASSVLSGGHTFTAVMSSSGAAL